MQSTDTDRSDMDTTKKLNELLRGEMSAVETYGKALEVVRNCSCKAELESAMACHKKRSEAISNKVTELGAEPSNSSGAWGAFANAMEAGATIFGEKAAIDMLEEGEDHGLKQYKELMEDGDLTVQQVVQEFLPKQEGTHQSMRELKTRLAA